MTTEREVNETQLLKFMDEFAGAQTDLVFDNPEKFRWFPAKGSLKVQINSLSRAAITVMRDLKAGTYWPDTLVMTETCKRLGIENTRESVEKFLAGR